MIKCMNPAGTNFVSQSLEIERIKGEDAGNDDGDDKEAMKEEKKEK